MNNGPIRSNVNSNLIDKKEESDGKDSGDLVLNPIPDYLLKCKSYSTLLHVLMQRRKLRPRLKHETIHSPNQLEYFAADVQKSTRSLGSSPPQTSLHLKKK